jgi:carboxypeptidase family protein
VKLGIRVSTALAVVLGLLLVPALAAAAPTGSIEGVVTDSSSHEPIEEAVVCAFRPSEEEESCEETDALGEYTLSGLAAGSYDVVFFADFEGLNYITQFYNDKPFFSEAETVTVGAGATAGIDAEMTEGSRITGRVTDAASAAPVGKVEVCAIEAADEEEFVSCEETEADGEYAIAGLPSGSYKVEFWAPELGYETQFYNGKASFSEAAVLTLVAPGSIEENINAAMVKPEVVKPTLPHIVIPSLPTLPPVLSVPTPRPQAKPLKCTKGKVKKKVHGKPECVKAKHHKKHKKARPPA